MQAHDRVLNLTILLVPVIGGGLGLGSDGATTLLLNVVDSALQGFRSLVAIGRCPGGGNPQ